MLVTIKNNTKMTIAFSLVKVDGGNRSLILEGEKVAQNINVDVQEAINELNSLAKRQIISIITQKEFIKEKEETLITSEVKNTEKEEQPIETFDEIIEDSVPENKNKNTEEAVTEESITEENSSPTKKRGRPKKNNAMNSKKEFSNEELEEIEKKCGIEDSTVYNPENTDVTAHSIKTAENDLIIKQHGGIDFIEHDNIPNNEPVSAKTVIMTKDGPELVKTKTTTEIFFPTEPSESLILNTVSGDKIEVDFLEL